MEKVAITIIGAGIVGLAIASALSDKDKDILVIERHDSFGQETSSRNSEVIHAGLYYPKNSLKAETCVRGKHLLYDLCEKNNIPHKKLGKILVACNPAEEKKLESIYNNAASCGVTNLRFLDNNDIKKLEPSVSASMGFFSGDTGIIDSHSVMKFFYNYSKAKNASFAFNVEVTSIDKKKGRYIVRVKEPEGDSFTFESKIIINSAGLSSNKIAGMVGIDIEKNHYAIHPCKGQYFRIRNPKKFSITHPVYPPPTNIDLGIHLTPDLAGGLRLGPDAKYVNEINYGVDEKALPVFCESVRRFLPSVKEEDLMPDTSGIRPKLQAKDEAFRDFVIKDEAENGFPNFINLIGIESPGLTACLAIAQEVKNILSADSSNRFS